MATLLILLPPLLREGPEEHALDRELALVEPPHRRWSWIETGKEIRA
jgi:hypothetical protein